MDKLIEILQNQKNVKVIAPEIEHNEYVAFVLSANTTESLNLPLTDAKAFENFVESHLAKAMQKSLMEVI